MGTAKKITLFCVGILLFLGCTGPIMKNDKSDILLLKPPEHAYISSQVKNHRKVVVKLQHIKTEKFTQSYKNCNKWGKQYGFEPSTIHECGYIRPKKNHYPSGIKRTHKHIFLEKILNLKSSYFVYYKSQLDRSGAYLVSYDKKTHRMQKSFDLKNYEYPSVYHVRRAWARQLVDWAEIKDGILYLATSSGEPEAVNGKTGFLTSVDLKTNTILWRSKEQTCNSKFVVLKDIIVGGYGLTAHQDYIYVFNKHNGKIVQKIPLAYAATDIEHRDGKIYVATRGYTYIFKIIK